MGQTKILTYRHAVFGQMLEFLDKWDVNTGAFQTAIFDLIDRLNNYQEEGERLRPHVFVLDDEDFFACNQKVALDKAMVLWEGEPFEGMYEWAIKKFAPLCRLEWKLFISIGPTSRIGLFGSSPAVTGVHDLEPFSEIRGVAIRSIAENVVEVTPGKGEKLEIHFSLRREMGKPIFENTDRLIDSIVSRLPEQSSNGLVRRVVKKTIFEAIYAQHGFLAAVVESKEKFDSLALNDVLCLKVPLSLGEATEEYSQRKCAESYFSLVSLRHLIHGMLLSDGITFFSAAGEVLGYNGFVPVGSNKATGGARKRAFLSLSEMVEKGDVLGAYIHSQDGNSQWCS